MDDRVGFGPSVFVRVIGIDGLNVGDHDADQEGVAVAVNVRDTVPDPVRLIDADRVGLMVLVRLLFTQYSLTSSKCTH